MVCNALSSLLLLDSAWPLDTKRHYGGQGNHIHCDHYPPLQRGVIAHWRAVLVAVVSMGSWSFQTWAKTWANWVWNSPPNFCATFARTHLANRSTTPMARNSVQELLKNLKNDVFMWKCPAVKWQGSSGVLQCVFPISRHLQKTGRVPVAIEDLMFGRQHPNSQVSTVMQQIEVHTHTVHR